MNLISHTSTDTIDRRNLSALIDIMHVIMNISNGNSLIMIPLSVDGQWSLHPHRQQHCTVSWPGAGGRGAPTPHCPPWLQAVSPPLSWLKSSSRETGPANSCFSFIANSAIYLFVKISPHSIKCRRNHVSRLRIPPARCAVQTSAGRGV